MSEKRKYEQPLVNSNMVTELSEKLFEANAKLKQNQIERTLMVENISHDLRAPLTAIRSTIDYLTQKNASGHLDMTDEEVTSLIKLLDSRTQTLEVLIHDLYYLTCLESGRDELKKQVVPLSHFLEEYYFAADMDDRYEKRHLLMDVPADYDKKVSIDVAKMSRVLDNFFTNAEKYSEAGDIITLGVVEKEGSAVFYVKDTGRGISKENLTRIFDRTFRVSSSRTPTDKPGSGLGLSIVKTIVEQHGGRVWCESVLGEGSSFFVELPSVSE
jgi:signal transduction histidine kinase